MAANKAQFQHPLDALSPVEMGLASTACKDYAAKIGAGELRFNTMMACEPPKSELLRFEAGLCPAPERQAQCVLIVPSASAVVEAMVCLHPSGAAEVVQWKNLAGVHPLTTPEDDSYAESIMKKDPTLQRLLRERYGITDLDSLVCDTWACHNAPEHLNHRRLMQGFLYMRHMPGDNEYAHPLDLAPIVDLNTAEVVHIDMYDTPPKVPELSVNYHRDHQTTWREDIAPLYITQPQGPSFQVEGSLVKWQRWSMRVGFNPREGLVVHRVGYEDGGRVRPVIHRMSLVEMAVPYGDPNYVQARKSAMDSGDYGFGLCANSLTLGCDCVGHIKYFDGIRNTSTGEPVVVKNAICMHEEDAGILWKHTDIRTGHVEVRRSRKLVLQMVSTFMNYEYLISYNFFQDGSIHFEAKLSGILSTSMAPPGEVRPTFGVRVAPNVNATVHQHFFCVRIDPSVDDPEGGKHLVVSEVEAESLPEGPENPFGNAFHMKETDMTCTDMAQRNVNFATARAWKIKNPNRLNPITGEPVAFKIMPGPTPAMMMRPSSLVYQRALFATKNLWVTPHHDEQRYAAGEHVVQSKHCLGLGVWTKENKSLLDGADPVLWYSFGITHTPRIEDWPVMPVEQVGFMIKPTSFFTGNPALDIPPTRNELSREHANSSGSGDGEACCMKPRPAAEGAQPLQPPHSLAIMSKL